MIPPAKSNHLKIFEKIPLEIVRVASLFLLRVPLDQGYFWICDVPGWDTYSEQWRLEIYPPTKVSTCSIEACHS